MAISGWLLVADHAITGSAFGGGTLTYLVSLFVLGKRSQSQSLADKRTDPAQRESNLLQN